MTALSTSGYPGPLPALSSLRIHRPLTSSCHSLPPPLLSCGPRQPCTLRPGSSLPWALRAVVCGGVKVGIPGRQDVSRPQRSPKPLRDGELGRQWWATVLHTSPSGLRASVKLERASGPRTVTDSGGAEAADWPGSTPPTTGGLQGGLTMMLAGATCPRMRTGVEGGTDPILMPGTHEIIAQQLQGHFPLALKLGSSDSRLDPSP